MFGSYSKADISAGLEYLGADEEEGRRILEEYDESKTRPKIKKERPKTSGSLEISIIKEDLKKVGKEIRNIGHVLRTPFLVPTTVRKVKDCDYDNDWYDAAFPVIGALGGVGLFVSIVELYKTGNPKLATLLLATTAITNLASGIYEYIKHIKNKSE